MGKPFKRELALLNETYKWAKSIELDFTLDDIENIFSYPTYSVGSGGSFSACHMFSMLHQARGGFSKPVTPLDLHYSTSVIRNSNIFFLSASGKNSDILFAYNTAIKNDALNIWGICMKKNTLLSNHAKNHSISKIIEYNPPAGKDGFLATNSLIAYFTLLSRLFRFTGTVESFGPYDEFQNSLNGFIERLDPDFTITVLYAGWSQPVAVDIESKFTEAGLGNILLTDYRNFGHGRHNWFDKKRRQSAIIALITPDEKKLADKTLSLLPNYIPILKVCSRHEAHLSTLDLLIQSFHIVNSVGERVGIDPGKPGVPSYGRKLYNLRYQSIVEAEKKNHKKINAILRKTSKRTIEELNEEELRFWNGSLNAFSNKMNSEKFGALIIDYDGTVCTKEERSSIPSELIVKYLNSYLKSGYVLGVVTGRGKSIRKTLQECIDKKYWHNVIIGYYNGGEIAALNDDSKPDIGKEVKSSLKQIYHLLQNHSFHSGTPTLTLRPLQLTIEKNGNCDWMMCKRMSLEVIAKNHFGDIQILESGHSIDIISKPEVSKTNIIKHCIEMCKEKGLPEKYICIGDKGKYPGNDYELLMSEFSLSVDEVSLDHTTCWNLSEPGSRGTSSFLQYLESLIYHKTYFSIAL